MSILPLPTSNWTKKHAAHLLNRAGFGGTPEEMDAIFELGVEQAVEKLVSFDSSHTPSPPDWTVDGFLPPPDNKSMRDLPEQEQREKRRENQKQNREQMQELQHWWMDAMLHSADPLQEKLTLFWHGHFATSFQKVKNTYSMFLQNAVFRKHANGSFKKLTLAVSKDPAMLFYLDNNRNRKKAPNENYARELMELFTMGEGHYTEMDIRESARAFTGWTANRRTLTYQLQRRQHDDGKKTFFGKTGNFGGEDIIDIIFEQPVTAEFITRKLWAFFVDTEPGDEVIQTLAQTLRDHQYELRPLLLQIFRSEAFYSKDAFRAQIKSPTQWLIQSLKVSEKEVPPSRFVTQVMNGLGQVLFAPPNVKGWDGGKTWVNTSSLMQRYQLVNYIVKGNSSKSMSMKPDENAYPSADAKKLVPNALRTSNESVFKALEWRVFQDQLPADARQLFLETLQDHHPQQTWKDSDVLNLIIVMMKTPHYQLC